MRKIYINIRTQDINDGPLTDSEKEYRLVSSFLPDSVDDEKVTQGLFDVIELYLRTNGIDGDFVDNE